MTKPEEATALLAQWRQSNAEGAPFGRWAVEERTSGVPAGTILLVPIPGGDGEVEVGWHLHPDAWGRGLATEAARAVIAYGFCLACRRFTPSYAPTTCGPARSAGGSA